MARRYAGEMNGFGVVLGIPLLQRFHWLDVAVIMVGGQIGFILLWWVWQVAKDVCQHLWNLAARP